MSQELKATADEKRKDSLGDSMKKFLVFVLATLVADRVFAGVSLKLLGGGSLIREDLKDQLIESGAEDFASSTKFRGPGGSASLLFSLDLGRPINLVSLGVFYENWLFMGDNNDYVSETFRTISYGPEIQIYLPLGGISPYATFRKAVAGKAIYTAKPSSEAVQTIEQADAPSGNDALDPVESFTLDGKLTGVQGALGLHSTGKFGKTPFENSFFLQIAFAQKKITINEYQIETLNGARSSGKLENANSFTIETLAASLGVSFDF